MQDHDPRWQRLNNFCQKNGEMPTIRVFVTREKFSDQERAQNKPQSERSLIFTLSTPGVKRDGFEIMQNGWLLDDYRNNPVVPWAHNYDELPIATSLREWVGESKKFGGRVLRGEPEFLTAEENEFADRVFGLYKRGVLNAASVGWKPKEYEWIYEDDDEKSGYITGIRFLKQYLLEYSMVPVPADPDALQQSFASGVIRKEDFPRFDISQMIKDQTEELARGQVFYIGHDVPAAQKDMPTNTWVDLGAADVAQAASNPPVSDNLAVSPEQAEPEKEQDETTRRIEPFVETDLPGEGYVWNPIAAHTRIMAWAVDKDGAHDREKYRQAFLYYEPETLVGRGLHHDIVNGALCVVPQAVKETTQRLMQGNLSIPGELLAEARQHLADEHRRFDTQPPWLSAIGRFYESTHYCLMTEEVSLEEQEKLETMLIDAAETLFGEQRLDEPWEKPFRRRYGENSFWAPIAEAIDTEFMWFLPDSEERTHGVFNLVDRLQPLFKTHHQAIGVVAELFKLTGANDANSLIGKVRSWMDKENQPEPEPTLDAAEITKATERLGKLLQREASEKKSTKSLDKEPSPAIKELRSTFADFLDMFPDAGKASE